MSSDSPYKEFDDICPNPSCEEKSLVIEGDKGNRRVMCDSCGVIYYKGLDEDDKSIVLDRFCYFCDEYGVRYDKDDEKIKCLSCGRILVE